MVARAINLTLAIAALMLVSGIATPAMYRLGGVVPALIAFALTGACAAWIIYAYHLVVEQWHQDMVRRGRQ